MSESHFEAICQYVRTLIVEPFAAALAQFSHSHYNKQKDETKDRRITMDDIKTMVTTLLIQYRETQCYIEVL